MRPSDTTITLDGKEEPQLQPLVVLSKDRCPPWRSLLEMEPAEEDGGDPAAAASWVTTTVHHSPAKKPYYGGGGCVGGATMPLTPPPTASLKRPLGRSDSPPQSQGRRRRNISFGTVQVVHFWPRIGDHPFVSSGCPIALGEPIQGDVDGDTCDSAVDVERYEQERPSHQRRPSRQLKIPPDERFNMLRIMGHSQQEIMGRTRDIQGHSRREYCSGRQSIRQQQLKAFYGAMFVQQQRIAGNNSSDNWSISSRINKMQAI
jgi:hypothetical protein